MGLPIDAPVLDIHRLLFLRCFPPHCEINAMMRPSDLGWNRFTQWRRPPTHCCTTICIRTCPQGKDRRPRPSVHDLNLTRSIGIIRCGIALIVHLHRGENQRAIAVPKDLPYRQMVSNCQYGHAGRYHYVVPSVGAVIRIPMHTGRQSLEASRGWALLQPEDLSTSGRNTQLYS